MARKLNLKFGRGEKRKNTGDLKPLPTLKTVASITNMPKHPVSAEPEDGTYKFTLSVNSSDVEAFKEGFPALHSLLKDSFSPEKTSFGHYLYNVYSV